MLRYDRSARTIPAPPADSGGAPPGASAAGGPVILPLQLRLFLLCVSGWIHRGQQDAIDYLREENRVLLELLGEAGRRRFTDSQRARLARKAKALGRRGLDGVCGIVTPDTLLRWYRRLVAAKYTPASPASGRRSPGRGRAPAGPPP